MAGKKKEDGLSFEDALARLEKIVEEMESAELPLDEVLKRYEEGMQVSEVCTRKLAEAEAKIEVLSRKKEAVKESATPSQPLDSEDSTPDDEENSLF